MEMSGKITADLDVETRAIIHDLAQAQGVTDEVFAAEAIRRVAESEAEFLAFVQVGIDSADRGELEPHDKVFADLRARRRQRRAA